MTEKGRNNPVIFLTSNKGKFREAKEILPMNLQRKNLELKEIQAIEIEEVVKHKLDEAYRKLRKPLFVEDTGLFIQAWNRLPGALTKFFLRSLGIDWISKKVGKNREASAETYVGYTNGEVKEIFRGAIEGEIPEEPRGEGFGWDPIFQPQGHEKTFGEMSKEEKNRISMRRKAFHKLENWLESRST